MRIALPDSLQPGWPMPFGAHLVDGGVHFALWSEHASRIELCLFDTDGARELRRYEMHADADGVWNGFLPELRDGLVYGYRAHGPYAPDAGHRFNPHKLLLDPWAREIVGRFHWEDLQHGYAQGQPDGARSFDARDNAAVALKARVAAPLPPMQHPRPRIAAADVVIYELHVKGFTMQMPGIPEALRGSFAALAHPAAIAHFRKLGVTTLALLPVMRCLSEAALVRAGLTNYWGYNTIGFFAADRRFESTKRSTQPSPSPAGGGGSGRGWTEAPAVDSDQPDDSATAELRSTIDALHAAGLEVILDVVYNHSAEGDELGPTISFRGLDNASWYRLLADDRSRCIDWSGCGNTLNLDHPRVVQFVLDSLRFWASEVGVDGFRFDLASVLGRTREAFDPHAPFFVALRQDPLLSRLKLIAEPWDCGPQGYQVGRFPGPFLDWNDRFRDSVRRYWLGLGAGRGEFARRFCGSSDLFHHGLRRPTASVNYVCSHDGRTLADVVSYASKHNQGNGEDNRDGRDGEPADNFGVEGPAADAQVNEQRRRVRRALLATTLLAQGTPMLLAGDEHANSQRGNNNAYCQDNPLGWLDWNPQDDADYVAALTALRREQSLLRHPHWFAASGDGAARVRWSRPDGQEMQLHDWHDAGARAFACELLAAGESRPRLRLLFNPEPTTVVFAPSAAGWRLRLDSSGELAAPGADPVPLATAPLNAPARSLLVLAPPIATESAT